MTARDRTVLIVVGALALIGAFWFLIVSPKHKDATAATEAVTVAQERLDAANQRVVAAQASKRTYARDYSKIAQLGKAVPVDDEVPSLVYQLSSTADAHGIDFRSIKLNGSSSAGTAPPVATAPPAGTPATPATTTPSTATPAATTATTAPATNAGTAALPPGALVGTANFPLMPFNFVFDGSFFDMASFLREIDRFTTVKKNSVRIRGRLMTIDGIAVKASRKGFPRVSAAVTANAYLLPANEGLTAGATSSTPASGSSGGSTPTPAPAAVATGR